MSEKLVENQTVLIEEINPKNLPEFKGWKEKQ